MHARLRFLLNRCRLALRPRVVVLPTAWASFNRGRALILAVPHDVLPARQKLILLDLHTRTAPPFPAGEVLRDDALTADAIGEPEWAVDEDISQLWRAGWLGLSHTYPGISLLTAPVTVLTVGIRLQHLLDLGYDAGFGVLHTSQRA